MDSSTTDQTTNQETNSSPESRVEYFAITDIEYIGLTTYFEYLFNEGYILHTFDKADAIQLGFERALPIQTINGDVFYVAMSEEIYQSACTIGNPDKYFKAYNYILNQEHEKIIKEATQVPFR